MLKVHFLLPVLCVALLLCPNTLQAETAEELDQLRAELALVKMKLKSAEKKLAANDAGSDVTTNSVNTPRVKPVADLFEIFKGFPSEAQPDRKGEWSTSAAAEANERLEYAVWGIPYSNDLKISKIEVTENRQLQNDGDASPWFIEISFNREEIEYQGATIRQSIKTLKIYADDARARRARKLEAGDELRIRGRIVTIENAMFANLAAGNGGYVISLRDLDIPGITK